MAAAQRSVLHRFSVFKIYFISDRKLTPGRDPSEPLLGAIEAGVDMVQVRDKDLPAFEKLRMASLTVEAARGRKVDVYVSSRLDVAIAAGADGVHLPADALTVTQLRRATPAPIRVGVSTHSLREALAAEGDGADFITFGPVFETASKAPYGPPVGLEALRAVLDEVRLPVFAIGGIHPGNVERVADLPVHGIAVISAIARADDRRSVVDRFRAAARQIRGGVE